MKHRLTILFFLLTLLGHVVRGQSLADTNKTFHMHATFYSDKFVGRKTSNGEIFKQDKYTAAHKSIKLGTLVLVTNPKNGKQVIVKVNDRCPRPGILDLTKKAARFLGVSSSSIEVQVLPERYRTIWEHMDDYKKQMEAGTILTLNPQPAPSKIQPESTISPEALYDLELCVANTRLEAQKIIDRLPMHYQSLAEMVPSNKSLMVGVKLTLYLRKEKAESIRKEFLGQFPNARLIPSKKQSSTR